MADQTPDTANGEGSPPPATDPNEQEPNETNGPSSGEPSRESRTPAILLTIALGALVLLGLVRSLATARVNAPGITLDALLLLVAGLSLTLWALAVLPRLRPPAPVATPSVRPGLPALEALAEAQKFWDGQALRGGRHRAMVGQVAVLLGPTAVLLLATQLLLIPEASPWSVTLIFVELLVLLGALVIGLFGLGQSNTWVRDRLRAETLRREHYMLMARLGPYLRAATEAELTTAVNRRLARIGSIASRPLTHLRLAHDGEDWRDALEDAGRGRTASPDDDLLDTYVTERLKQQHDWFAERSEAWRRHSALYVNASRAALAAALVLTAMHLVFLLVQGLSADEDSHWLLRHLIEVAAVSLPSIGAAAIALESLGQGKRLSHSYQHVMRHLEKVIDAFEKLRLERRGEEASRAGYEFRLKRLVLTAEDILAKELHDWWLLMHVEHARAGA